MRLQDLLSYEKVTIQCHDNPDADAIASGYGIYCYLKENNVPARLIYSGRYLIQKDNLKMLVKNLEIPIEYVTDHNQKMDGLLVTVDCQYGAKNVEMFAADDVIIIDHHNQQIFDIEKTYILSNRGSCSTVVWELLKKENFEFSKYPELETALYYGLYTDTIQFTDINHPLDKDMRDTLNYDKQLIHRLQNSNINAEELEIAGVAMLRTIVNRELRYAVVRSAPCDPNILGLISDFVLQVSEVDTCIVFNVLESGIKFSVRSCIKEAGADHIAAFISRGIGSGGGHRTKAGGYIDYKKYSSQYSDFDEATFFSNRIKKFHQSYDVYELEKEPFDIDDCELYKRKKIRFGYVNLSEMLPVGKPILIRTAESDLHMEVEEDMFITIGIKGEAYLLSEDEFNIRYELSDGEYEYDLEYQPKLRVMDTGKEYSLIEYVKPCISTDVLDYYAKKLERGVKLFTAWDPDCYMVGEVGDYVVMRKDNPQDVYVISADVFEKTFVKI